MCLIPLMFLMRSLTLRSMFSTSPSTVSFNPDDWAPSVSTTLGYNTLASEESIRSSPAAWCGCERGRLQPSSCASEWPCLWVIPPSELLLTACSRGEQLSFSVWLLLPWSWTACCYQAWGTACLVPWEKKKRKRSENQFLIKQICKGCIKRCSTFALAHLSFWCDLDNAMRRLTNSERACLLRKMLLLLSYSWLIVGSSLPSLSNTIEAMARLRASQNANQYEGVCPCVCILPDCLVVWGRSLDICECEWSQKRT